MGRSIVVRVSYRTVVLALFVIFSPAAFGLGGFMVMGIDVPSVTLLQQVGFSNPLLVETITHRV
jgi:hypothetical protein